MSQRAAAGGSPPRDSLGTVPDLVLVRHGQSEWNELNRFTGWVDVGLTDRGRAGGEAGGPASRRDRGPGPGRGPHVCP